MSLPEQPRSLIGRRLKREKFYACAWLLAALFRDKFVGGVGIDRVGVAVGRATVIEEQSYERFDIECRAGVVDSAWHQDDVVGRIEVVVRAGTDDGCTAD